MRLKYLKNEFIEDLTTQRIREYEQLSGSKVTFPIPLEKIVERILGLDFDWDYIEEQTGEQILGGLNAKEKKIILNEKHCGLFEQKPGLERSTIGHEAGHWDVDIDRAALMHPNLPGFEMKNEVVQRSCQNSDLLVQVLKRAATDERYAKVYKKITQGQDSSEVKSAVDRYQSALLMPKWLIEEAREKYCFTNWKDLYQLAENAQVTISNLTIRLQRLDLLYIDKDGNLFNNKSEFNGQLELELE